jgi:hypothetical protein
LLSKKQFSKVKLPNRFSNFHFSKTVFQKYTTKQIFFHSLLKNTLQKTCLFLAVILRDFKKPPQIDVIFPTPAPSIFIFPLFPFHFIHFKKAKKEIQ